MKLAAIVEADYVTVPVEDFADADITSETKLGEVLAQLEIQMREAAKKFEFERAAALRDRIRALKQRDLSGFFFRRNRAGSRRLSNHALKAVFHGSRRCSGRPICGRQFFCLIF